MHYFGLSANLMSLGGLAIAIGMMVDGTIVVVENVDRILRQAEPDEGRIQVVARRLRGSGPSHCICHHHHHYRVPTLVHPSGSRGQNVPPPRLHCGYGHVGLIDFCPVLGPGVVEPVTEGTKIQARRHPSQRRLDDAPLGGCLSTHCHALRRPPLLGTRLSGRPPAHRTVDFFPRLGSEFTPALQEGTMVLRLTMAPSISLKESTRITMLVERRLLQIPEVTGAVSRIGRGEVGAHTDPDQQRRDVPRCSSPRISGARPATKKSCARSFAPSWERFPGCADQLHPTHCHDCG